MNPAQYLRSPQFRKLIDREFRRALPVFPRYRLTRYALRDFRSVFGRRMTGFEKQLLRSEVRRMLWAILEAQDEDARKAATRTRKPLI